MQYGTQGNVPGAGVQKPWTPAEYFPGTTTFINKEKKAKQFYPVLHFLKMYHITNITEFIGINLTLVTSV